MLPMQLAFGIFTVLDRIAERRECAEQQAMRHREGLVGMLVGAVERNFQEERRLREIHMENIRERDASQRLIIIMLIILSMFLVVLLFWRQGGVV